MNDIKKLIVDNIASYSKNQKILANYLLENLETVPLLSVNELAKNTGCSTATVVRFTRVLGFEGYLDFRNHLLKLLKTKLSPLERYKETLSHKEEMPNTLEKVADKVIENLRYSVSHNDLEEFKEIVGHIRKAKNIFCAGLGISKHMAEIFTYLLKLYMKKAFALHNDSPSFQEQVILLDKDDLLFVFSFPPYSRPTVEMAREAKENGVTVIAFTDKRTAPVVQYCEHALLAKSDNILFTNSLGAIAALMNALITELALCEETTVISGLEKVENYLSDERYFY